MIQALKGRNMAIVPPFQGLKYRMADPVPRALPWADMLRPLRGEMRNFKARVSG
jgi:hypothetical protein